MHNFTRLPIVLRPGIGRRIAIVLGSLIFGAIAVLVIAVGLEKLGSEKSVDPWSLVAVLVGFLCGAMSLAGLLSAFLKQLTLDTEGFALKGVFKTNTYGWRDVDGEFRPFHVETGQGANVAMVCWNLVPGTKPISAWRKLNRTVGEGSIPAMFGGLNAEQLAALMNRIRDDQTLQA
jgi:hypothetical protein